MQQHLPIPAETTVKPGFRKLGALVLFILTLVFATSTYQLLQTATPVFRADSCSGKGQMLCELGNWLMAAIPDSIQFPLEIASGMALTLFALYGTIHLCLPKRSDSSLENLK